jgi:hypothetical protein
MLGGIGQLMTMATSEDGPAVKNSHPPSASSSGTTKPNTLSAVVAGSPLQKYGIFLIGPFTARRASPIVENYAIILRTDIDISQWLAVSSPSPAK